MRRKALIVPVLKPQHNPLPDEAHRPVSDLSEALQTVGRFAADDVVVIETRDMQRSRRLPDLIANWVESLTQDDLGLLYFGGHGEASNGDALLGCWDASPNDTAGWLNLRRTLSGFREGRLLVVLDTCHAGAAAKILSDRTMPAHEGRCLLFVFACPAADQAPALSDLTPVLVEELHGGPRSPAAIAIAVADRVGAAYIAGDWTDLTGVLLNPGGAAEHLPQDTTLARGEALAAYRRSVLNTVHVQAAPWDGDSSILDDAAIERLIVPLLLQPHATAGDEHEDERGTQLLLERNWSLRELADLGPDERTGVSGRWWVRGGPGAGKSTELRRLARSLAAAPEGRWIPVWAPLPWAAGSAESLPKRVAAPCTEVAPGLAEILEQEARAGNVVLLCDGLDELPAGRSRELALDRLKMWAEEWPGPIIVAGRRHGVSLEGPFLPVDVQPLGPEHQLQLVRERLGGGLAPPRFVEARAFLDSHRARLGDLAGNPFYLTLLALVFASGERPGATPARMYLKVINILLRGKHRRESDGRPAPSVRNPKRTFQALTRLALRMTEEAPDQGTADEADEDDLVDWLDGDPGCRSQAPLELLEDVACKAGFLVREPHDPGRWRFLHRAFREVLCASALVSTLSTEPEGLAARAANTTAKKDVALWANPWALAAGLLDAPDPLLVAVLDVNEALATDALLGAPTVSPKTFQLFLEKPFPERLELVERVERRRRVYLAVAARIHDPRTALSLAHKVSKKPLAPEERWFLEELCDAIAARWPDSGEDAEHLRQALYADLPDAPDDLVEWCDIPEGGFWMGSPNGIGDDDEHPRHHVTLSQAYHLGRTPVTNAQYRVFAPTHEPYRPDGVNDDELPHHPVVYVSYYAAQAFCRWMSLRTRTGRAAAVRLPTEAEWERACRGPGGMDQSCNDRWWFGDDESRLADYAWYEGNSENRTHGVATTPGEPKHPWGVEDMYGNVQEWCWDSFESDYYSTCVANDPMGPDDGRGGVLRGGNYLSTPVLCRSAYRFFWRRATRQKYRGFRVLLPAAPSGDGGRATR